MAPKKRKIHGELRLNCAQSVAFDRNVLVYKKKYGGPDGTRTRDPRRDRPVF